MLLIAEAISEFSPEEAWRDALVAGGNTCVSLTVDVHGVGLGVADATSRTMLVGHSPTSVELVVGFVGRQQLDCVVLIGGHLSISVELSRRLDAHGISVFFIEFGPQFGRSGANAHIGSQRAVRKSRGITGAGHERWSVVPLPSNNQIQTLRERYPTHSGASVTRASSSMNRTSSAIRSWVDVVDCAMSGGGYHGSSSFPVAEVYPQFTQSLVEAASSPRSPMGRNLNELTTVSRHEAAGNTDEQEHLPTMEEVAAEMFRSGGMSVAERPAARPVLISGWFGSNNLGDELILDVITASFRRWAPAQSLIAVSPFAARTEELHHIPCIERSNASQISATLRGARSCLLGGGGLMQDYTFAINGGAAGLVTGARQSIAAYAGMCQLAGVWGIPLHIYAQGVGPLRSIEAQQSVRHVFSGAESLSVRDSGSERLLRGLPGWDRDVHLVPDVVFGVDLPVDLSRSRLPNDDRTILVNLRQWPYDAAYSPSSIILRIGKIASANGLRVVALPFSDDDESFLRAVVAAIDGPAISVLPYTPDITIVAADLARARAALGMRYHFSVVAMMVHTPVAGFVYDPKVRFLFEDFEACSQALTLAPEDEDLGRVFDWLLACGGTLPEPFRRAVEEKKGAAQAALKALVVRASA